MSAEAFSRRFAASGTGFARRSRDRLKSFARRYRDDSLLRTELNLVALQVGYALLVTGVATVALFILYREVTQGMTAAFVAILTSAPAPAPEAIQAELQVIRLKSVVDLAAVIFAVTAVFGYMVTRFALAPARSALAAQKRFIGNIAHELRTPLSVIRVNTEVGLLDPGLPEEARAVHQSNLEEIDRVSSLINNLLTLNALLRPEDIPFGNVDLGALAHKATGRLEGLAREHAVRIMVSTVGARPAWGNAAALEQIVMNLAKNAVQHTKNGRVRIHIAPAGSDSISLVVSDTGSGIRNEDLAHILEPFYRGDRARTRGGGAGSGLGLAIVNELVRLHRGRLRIQSTLGQGTRVAVIVSAGRGARARPRRPRETGEIRADFSKSRIALVLARLRRLLHPPFTP